MPKTVVALAYQFSYNYLNSLRSLLDTHSNGFAAIFLEPMNGSPPQKGFLEGARTLASEHCALFVFDETITCFCYQVGEAQAYFSITPDLATFSKRVANDYPLSVPVRRAQCMEKVEGIFFSGIFDSETFSLAAAKAVLQKLPREPLIGALTTHGQQIVDGTKAIHGH